LSKVDYQEFLSLRRYLEATFPLVHSKLKKELISEYGLLYTWEGSDSALKPLLLLAHQDVVPVENDTELDYTHPDFGFEDHKKS